MWSASKMASTLFLALSAASVLIACAATTHEGTHQTASLPRSGLAGRRMIRSIAEADILGTGMTGNVEDSDNDMAVYSTEQGGGEVEFAHFQGSKLDQWSNLDGDCDTKPAAASWGDDSIVVCVEDRDIKARATFSGKQTGWFNLGGDCETAPAVAANPGFFQVFCVDDDEKVRLVTVKSGETSGKWQTVNGVTSSSGPGAEGDGEGRTIVAVVDDDGEVKYNMQDSQDSSWSSNWDNVVSNSAVKFRGSPAVTTFDKGSVGFYATDTDGQVWFAQPQASEWTHLPAAICASDVEVTPACPGDNGFCVTVACYDKDGMLMYYEMSDSNDVNGSWIDADAVAP